MFTSDQLTQVTHFITQAQTIVVLISPSASSDHLAAASALVTALGTAGKEALFASPRQPDYLTAEMSAGHLLRTELGNQNLTIAFDYTESAVDKVSYHISEETNKFYLTIKPRQGEKPLEAQGVEVSYTGTQADLVFLIGVTEYESLDHLYFANEQLFQDATVITLHTFEPEIGSIKLDASGHVCLSASMGEMLSAAGLTLTSDAATDLLYGIEEATQGLRSLSMTAEAFEMVAWLLKQGARRLYRGQGDDSEHAVGDSGKLAEIFSQKTKTNGHTQVASAEQQSLDDIADGEVIAQQAENSEEHPVYLEEKSVKKPKKKKSTIGGLDFQPSGFGAGGSG